jgi:thiosulfate dehydrogenase [quinone] large subunit
MMNDATRVWSQTVRVLFGLVWAVDAAFKWAPGFRDHLLSYISTDGQPGWVSQYLSWWTGLLGHNPQLFAYGLALAESLLAVALILGWGLRATCIAGSVLSLLIWSTAEGFGGPYGPGSTDVGTSIAYVLVFALLWCTNAGAQPAKSLRLQRRSVAIGAAVATTTGLLVAAAVIVSSGPVPSDVMPHTMHGGQMQMSPGGQDAH